IELHSTAVTLTVLPLPDADRPPDFSGAVGHFDFDVKAAPLELTAGDPVTVTSTIHGDGNFDGVTAPQLASTDALRTYPVQASSPSPQERRFEQVVMPQHPGTIALPGLRFSYFDPDQRAYRTITRPGVTLSVRPAARSTATPQVVG